VQEVARVSGGGKAGGEAVSYELFIFEDEALDEAFFRSLTAKTST
jgi:hypothetical protein